jgi:hypothetical protein
MDVRRGKKFHKPDLSKFTNKGGELRILAVEIENKLLGNKHFWHV